MTKVSVIVPNYNHRPFLKQRLDSIFNQTFKDYEVILLDDCSTDGSIEILDSYRNHPNVSHYVINKVNSGSAFYQWKKGLDLAKGEWIWLAETDDWADEYFLESLLDYSEQQQGVSFVYAQSYDVNSNGAIIDDRLQYTASFTPNIWRESWVLEGRDLLEQFICIKNVVPNASAVIFRNRADWKDIITEELMRMRMCGDWFFWIKLSATGSVGFINRHLNFFRHHESTTRTHDSKEKVVRRLIEQSIIEEHLLKEFVLKRKDRQLLERYLKYHEKLIDLFRGEFYNFRGGWSRIELVFFFMKYKFSKVKKVMW